MDYLNVFLVEEALVLLEQIKFNKYIIKIKDGKQSLYKPVYSLSSVKLYIVKILVKNLLKTRFIWFFKSLIGISILLNKKLDNNF